MSAAADSWGVLALQTLDRTGLELRLAVGGFKRTALYRLGLAAKAAGEADTEEAAHALVWDAILAVGEQRPIREALEHASVDVAAVARQLSLIERDWHKHLVEEEYELECQISRNMETARMAGVVA